MRMFILASIAALALVAAFTAPAAAQYSPNRGGNCERPLVRWHRAFEPCDGFDRPGVGPNYVRGGDIGGYGRGVYRGGYGYRGWQAQPDYAVRGGGMAVRSYQYHIHGESSYHIHTETHTQTGIIR